MPASLPASLPACSKRFSLVPLGPPLLTYSSTAKALLRFDPETHEVQLAVDRAYQPGEPILAWCGPQVSEHSRAEPVWSRAEPVWRGEESRGVENSRQTPVDASPPALVTCLPACSPTAAC